MLDQEMGIWIMAGAVVLPVVVAIILSIFDQEVPVWLYTWTNRVAVYVFFVGALLAAPAAHEYMGVYFLVLYPTVCLLLRAIGIGLSSLVGASFMLLIKGK